MPFNLLSASCIKAINHLYDVVGGSVVPHAPNRKIKRLLVKKDVPELSVKIIQAQSKITPITSL